MKCNLLPGQLCMAKWRTLEGGFILDESRKQTYNNDSKQLISFKCAGVFIANPFRVTVLMIAALAKSLFLLLAPLFKVCAICIQGFVKGLSLQDIQAELQKEFAAWGQNFTKAALSPGYTLFYGFMIQSGALLGLVDPLRGRKIIALSEAKWGELDHFLGKEATTMAPCFHPRPYNNIRLLFGFW